MSEADKALQVQATSENTVSSTPTDWTFGIKNRNNISTTPKDETVVVKAKQAVVDHWKVIVAVLVVLVVLFFLLAGSEKFNTSQVTDVLAKYNPLKLLRKK